MNKLFFATTNEGKLREAREILGANIEGTPLEIEEIQSLDAKKVAIQKAKDYFKVLQKPIFVEDLSLTFNALNGLPGAYISDFLKAVENEGLIELLNNKQDRTAAAQTYVVFIDKDGQEYVFEGKVEGIIAEKPRGEGFGWDPIFIPLGQDKTFGEMSIEEKNKHSMRAIALKKMKKWLGEQSF